MGDVKIADSEIGVCALVVECMSYPCHRSRLGSLRISAGRHFRSMGCVILSDRGEDFAAVVPR